MKNYKVEGMTCQSCARRVEEAVRGLEGVRRASVNFEKSELSVDWREPASEEEVKAIVAGLQAGNYVLRPAEEPSGNTLTTFFWVLIGLVALGALYLFYLTFFPQLEFPAFPEPGSNVALTAIFLVGLFTGLHCVGMCGAFVATNSRDYRSLFLYLGSKTFSYALMGALLGALGGFFVVSNELRGFIALFAGLFMVAYALSSFGVGFARKIFALLPKPRIATGRNGPMAMGFLNAFMPCGPLQAMQLFALSTGDALHGGFIMLAFGLGTLPFMAGFGAVFTRLTKNASNWVLRAASFVVLFLGVSLLLNGWVTVSASFQPVQEIGLSDAELVALNESGEFQIINSDLYAYGYKPQVFTVKKGVPVKWIVDVKELTGCNNRVLIPEYGVDQALVKGENVVEFLPGEAGEVRYSCWMDMLRGKIVVSEEPEKVDLTKIEAPASGSCDGSCGGSCGGGCGGGCGGRRR